MADRLRVVVAAPFSDEDIAELRRREPRLDIEMDRGLLAEPGPGWQGAPKRSAQDQARFEALVDGAEALLGVPDSSGKALARTVGANPALRWVQTIQAGGGQIVRAAGLDAAALERIVFTTSAGAYSEPLAEFAVFGVLAGSRQLGELRTAQIRHEWHSRMVMPAASDMTVAVVGLGSIGRLSAQKLAQLGYHVVGVHRRDVQAEGVERVEPVERLADVAAEADALVLALPGTDATEKLIGRDVFARIKPGATVVNVGRGTTVDEPELVAALQDGRVGFAALDVFAVEPVPADSPLWDMPNVVISPHTAGVDGHEPRRVVESFAENARRFLDGEPLLNRVDTAEFY
ncbi:MAG TPA: D-2-hydroxyacid dehydrogenase [Pseudolysinimonas sp.]|nr:D-2-hydroxyacid dehydrogenase [Pseudolysinimonas sp.]